MKIFDFNIEKDFYEFFKKLINSFDDYSLLNEEIEANYNIIEFFECQDDFLLLKNELTKENVLTLFDNKIEYGDFQTPMSLSDQICSYLKKNNFNPEVIIEPTAGIGNFILSSMRFFKEIKFIFGIEINKHYVLISKLRILNYIINESPSTVPKVKIFNANVFNFSFKSLGYDNNLKVLILGNPPWVTNTTLSSINSGNLPQKTNFKKHNGLDALTGKSNFDISEYITLMIIKYFQDKEANLCFLVKNSVLKNLLFDQKKNNYKISKLKKVVFNAQKEFNVSVDACMFLCEFNKNPDLTIEETSLYNNYESKSFGWYKDNFVSNLINYKSYMKFDGCSQFTWRSGIKHDLTKVLELKKKDDLFQNKLGEEFYLEDELVFSHLKGSHLKEKIIKSSILYTIVTQKDISLNTEDIENKYPLTFRYLQEHESYFINRKSSIYRGKPKFSIFGIGDYSFKPYKIAIASLYKKFSISLVLPDERKKPIMLDDTCYFLSFDNLDFALITYVLINNDDVVNFINTLTFNDVMRKYTKEILMRIDLFKISQYFSFQDIRKKIKSDFEKYNFDIDETSWVNYINSIKTSESHLVFY